MVCKCRWIPTVSKRNVGPLWQVASDEGVVFPIIFCTCRESRLLQKVMYNHFGGYDTSVNRKLPVIRFFLKFMSTHSKRRAYRSRWLCFKWSLAVAEGGWQPQIDIYGHFGDWRKLQLIVNHLKSGVFQHSDFLHHPKVTHMTINSDGCGSYYPWHVPLQPGGQRETWPGTRSYLTFWKLQHILVYPMSSERGRCRSMRIYRFFPGQKPRRMWLLKVWMLSRSLFQF